jgi:hypothetical protein
MCRWLALLLWFLPLAVSAERLDMDGLVLHGTVEAYALLTDPPAPIAEGLLALDLLRLAIERTREVREA